MDTISFRLHRDYWDCGNLYNRCAHTFNKGLTVLVGCNGAGKSTTIRQIYDKLTADDRPVFRFDNISSGGNSFYSGLLEGYYPGGIKVLSSLVSSSEGEKIRQNLAIEAKTGLNMALKKAKESGDKELFLLFDAIDSGASIDNIIEVKDFFKLIIQDQKERNDIDVFVIVSANSYEMASGEACYDIAHNKYITFKDYDDYKKFIIKSRKFKNRRLEKFYKKKEESGGE